MIDVYLSIDVETSGFSAEAQVLEVAVVHYYRGQVVRRYSELVCPVGLTFEDEKVKQALVVNKLSVEALMYGASTFKKVRERFEQEVSEPVWVMHNAEFDTRMINYEYTRLGVPFPRPQYVFCTQTLDELINYGEKGHKLGDLCKRWDVMNKSEHRAFGDAEACGDIFTKMLGVLPPTLEEIADFYSRKQTLQWYNSIRSRA